MIASKIQKLQDQLQKHQAAKNKKDERKSVPMDEFRKLQEKYERQEKKLDRMQIEVQKARGRANKESSPSKAEKKSARIANKLYFASLQSNQG